MKLFALADLHLAGLVDKPMHIFGPRWERHADRIATNWEEEVGPDDTVLVGGDISWANSLEEALPDLTLIDALPGKKVLLKGNHDYWWTTIRKLEAFCKQEALTTLRFLRNDALVAAGFYICGTRGWMLPSDEEFSARDQKIYKREIVRLELSIRALKRLRKEEDRGAGTVALMHYPPISEQGAGSSLSDLLKAAGIEVCLFAHIHHDVPFYDSRPQIDGIRYIMVASDQVGFRPLLVGEDGLFAVTTQGEG
ncbi:MAG: serine/threonine protein phosphatase [Clostridiaceae bacterium]|nr:serine/threonine protein phosphatase [Clostridiaceae bacterium]